MSRNLGIRAGALKNLVGIEGSGVAKFSVSYHENTIYFEGQLQRFSFSHKEDNLRKKKTLNF